MKKVFIIAAIIAVLAIIAIPTPDTAKCADCGQEYKIADMVQWSGENSIVYVCRHCAYEMSICPDCINGTHK